MSLLKFLKLAFDQLDSTGTSRFDADGDHTLHKDNAISDFLSHFGSKGNGVPPEMIACVKRFDSFLKLNWSDARFKGPTERLSSFFLQRFLKEEISVKGFNAAAYVGNKVSQTTQFIAVKGLMGAGSLRIPDFSEHQIRDIALAVKLEVEKDSPSFEPDGMVSLSKLSRIDSVLRIPPRAMTGPPVKPVLNPSPLWLTRKRDFDAELQASNGIGSHAIFRSNTVAHAKKLLGLPMPHNNWTDEEGFAGGPSANIAVVVEANFSKADLSYTAQPHIFSGGFDYLFVSRTSPGPTYPQTADTDMPGRTVRLFDTRCVKNHVGCDCAGAGLPEAVVPTSVASNQTLTVRHVVYTTAASLRRYIPPAITQIRKMNGLASTLK